MDKKTHLFLSVLCIGGQVYEANVCSRDLLRTACQEAGINLTVSRNAATGVDRSRNQEVAKFLANPEYTHFMFLDADISFHPNHVLYMLKATEVEELNQRIDVVAAAYPRKQIDWEGVKKAVLKGISTEDLPKYATSFILNGFTGRGFAGDLGTFGESHELGTGFMMIKREVLEAIVKEYGQEIAYVTDYPPFGEVQHMVFKCDRDPNSPIEKAKSELLSFAKGDRADEILIAAEKYKKAVLAGKDSLGRYLTEDYNFCRMAESLGFKIFCYMDAAVHHLGHMTFEGEIRAGMSVQRVDNPEETPVEARFEVVGE